MVEGGKMKEGKGANDGRDHAKRIIKEKKKFTKSLEVDISK